MSIGPVMHQKITPLHVTEIPQHKRIAGTAITVDCFGFPVVGCTHYFLTHFHADHYTRLGKSFQYPVYCSATTAELVVTRLGATAVAMEMYKNYDFGAFVVRLIEANHCPGAVCIVFLINNQFVLHTGDFRYDKKYHMAAIHFSHVYLDNTYQGYQHRFQTQREAINGILDRFDQKNVLCRQKVCVLCCTYTVGKEKVFLSVAEYLDEKVQVSQDKMNTLKCYSRYTVGKINQDVLEIVDNKRKQERTFGFQRLARPVGLETSICSKKRATSRTGMRLPPPPLAANESDEIQLLCRIEDPQNIDIKTSIMQPFDRITTDEAMVKVISMFDLSSLDRVVSKVFADKIIVLCGTGWTEKTVKRNYRRMDGKTIKNGIEIVYFRYSEHSSPTELEEFSNVAMFDTLVRTVN